MYQTNMFAGAQPTAPAIEPFDLTGLAPQFAGWSFNLGQPWDQHTPQIAIATINEIQQQAMAGHPIRVGMFNIMAENAFNNPGFQDLLYTILMRVVLGVQNGEWRNLSMAVNTTIARAVKCCASALAASDAEFMAQMRPADAAAVRENAEIWNYLLQLAQGQAQFVPFSQMGAGGAAVLGTVSGSTQEALNAARGLRGTQAGAFVEGSGNDFGMRQGTYNNDATRGVGRYGRRNQIISGKLEGSMQQALHESGAAGAQSSAASGPYQARMRRPAVTTPSAVDPEVAQAAAKFDSDITDFSRSLGETQVVAAPAAAPQAKPLFSVQIGGEVVWVMRERKEGISAWKPSKYQRFHPAWCKRTHTVKYFETQQTGDVIAALVPLTDEQKEIAMNYEAHAIDPTKGKPDPEVPQKPVREQAKVLYAEPGKVNINVTIAQAFSSEEDVSGAIRSTRLSAELAEKVPDAYVKLSLVNQPVVYATSQEAEDDALVIKAIGGSKDFTEAASYIGKIRNELARKTVNDVMVGAINRAIVCELGVGVRITDFVEDGPAIIAALEEHAGSLVAEKLRAHQKTLLASNVTALSATEMKEYADATLVTEGQDELTEAMLQRVLFLQRNVCAVWVNFTDDELAIGVPDRGAAVIQADSLSTLNEIANTVFTEAIGNLNVSEQYLVTKDNVRYRLHRGLINRDCFLLSKNS